MMHLADYSWFVLCFMIALFHVFLFWVFLLVTHCLRVFPEVDFASYSTLTFPAGRENTGWLLFALMGSVSVLTPTAYLRLRIVSCLGFDGIAFLLHPTVSLFSRFWAPAHAAITVCIFYFIVVVASL